MPKVLEDISFIKKDEIITLNDKEISLISEILLKILKDYKIINEQEENKTSVLIKTKF